MLRPQPFLATLMALGLVSWTSTVVTAENCDSCEEAAAETATGRTSTTSPQYEPHFEAWYHENDEWRSIALSQESVVPFPTQFCLKAKAGANSTYEFRLRHRGKWYTIPVDGRDHVLEVERAGWDHTSVTTRVVVHGTRKSGRTFAVVPPLWEGFFELEGPDKSLTGITVRSRSVSNARIHLRRVVDANLAEGDDDFGARRVGTRSFHVEVEGMFLHEQIRFFANGRPVAAERIPLVNLDDDVRYRLTPDLPPGPIDLTARLVRDEARELGPISKPLKLSHEPLDFALYRSPASKKHAKRDDAEADDEKKDYPKKDDDTKPNASRHSDVSQTSTAPKVHEWSREGKGLVVLDDDGLHFKDKRDHYAPKFDAERVAIACRFTNSLVLESTFTPSTVGTSGEVVRIVTFSKDTSERFFTLGQQDEKLVFRLRTSDMPSGSDVKNGIPQGKEFELHPHLKKNVTYQVRLEYGESSGLHWKVWENGTETRSYSDSTKIWKGTFENWSTTNWEKWDATPTPSGFGILFGNERTMDRAWKGTISAVRISTKPKNENTTAALDEENSFVDAPPLDEENSFVDAPPLDGEPGWIADPVSFVEACPGGCGKSCRDDFFRESPEAEFTFPEPAHFPRGWYDSRRDGQTNQGAVLDEMTLRVAADGRYEVRYRVRTPVRAQIQLDLLVHYDGRWHTLSLPAQTIDANLECPCRVCEYGLNPRLGMKVKSLRDRQALMVDRRGSALFGTVPEALYAVDRRDRYDR